MVIFFYFFSFNRKDLLQDVIHFTNCCRDEYQSSSHSIQASINNVIKEQEYEGFITKNRWTLSLLLIFLSNFLGYIVGYKCPNNIVFDIG